MVVIVFFFLFFKEHIENLIKSLKIYKINKKNIKKNILNLIQINLNKNKRYDHLFRVAVNSKMISVSLRKRLKLKKKFSLKLINYKRVEAEYKNLKYKKIISYLKINKKQKTITTMPMGYSYGLSIVNSHLVAGSTVVLNNKTVIDKNFWNVIKKYKVNSFGGVPEFYEYLKRINFEKYITKSIKYLTQAGGKLEEKTLGYFGKICKKNKVKFYVMYGQAEASPRMTYLKWEKFFSKINSIGKPLKGYKIKLVDKNRKVINKTNTKGEIMFSGRNVSLGYAKNFNDLTKDDENKRTLFTGDLAIRDRENYLYIVGRKDRIIKLFGKRFDLDDIENFFKSKGIKAKCKFNNSKIILNLPLNSNTESEINSLSNFLGINRNFIIANKNLNRSFKDYSINEQSKSIF